MIEPEVDEEEEELPPEPKKEKKGKKSKNGEVVVIKAAQPPKPAPAPFKSEATIEPDKPKPIAPPKPSFDESRIAAGAGIVHKAFGPGVITAVDTSDAKFRYVTVRFEGVEKRFQIPNAFLQGFLKLAE